MRFVERLIALPRVQTNTFLRLSPSAALDIVLKEGTRYNHGNPWATSARLYDALRSRLGFWKAIGANDSVLSWLAYGVPAPFIREPGYYTFPNAPSVRSNPTYREFIARDLAAHLQDTSFIITLPHRVQCVLRTP